TGGGVGRGTRIQLDAFRLPSRAPREAQKPADVRADVEQPPPMRIRPSSQLVQDRREDEVLVGRTKLTVDPRIVPALVVHPIEVSGQRRERCGLAESASAAAHERQRLAGVVGQLVILIVVAVRLELESQLVVRRQLRGAADPARSDRGEPIHRTDSCAVATWTMSSAIRSQVRARSRSPSAAAAVANGTRSRDHARRRIANSSGASGFSISSSRSAPSYSSATPADAVTTAGIPRHNASRTARPYASYRAGCTVRSTAASSSGTSARKPRNRMRSPRPAARARSSHAGCSAPVPITTRSTSHDGSAHNDVQAAKTVSKLFRRSPSAPTNAAT